jgi:glutathione synthase
MKPLRIGIVMDPLESIKPKKDTTLALMLEAQARDWQVVYMTLGDLYLRDGRAEGFMRHIRLFADPEHWYSLEGETYGPLGELDVILMRKDPPFDMEYIMSTYILEQAQRDGALVINDPRALRDANEKAFTAWFPQCCPPSLFTRSKAAIRHFLETHQTIVLKPLGLMGGQSVFVVAHGDPNTNVIIEEITHRGSRFVQAQAYVPEIASTGDKRILLIDGKPVPYGIARIPGGDDHRGNMAAGAQPVGFELSDRDRWICDQLGPELKARGLFFVGIDVIGDFLTEINVTSPTGVREIDHFFHTNTPGLFFDALMPLLR